MLGILPWAGSTHHGHCVWRERERTQEMQVQLLGATALALSLILGTFDSDVCTCIAFASYQACYLVVLAETLAQRKLAR